MAIACTSLSREDERDITEPMTVLEEVDRLPAFPPCENVQTENEEFYCFQKNLMQHLADNLQYPVEAQTVGLQGQMQTQFVINRKGKVQDVEIISQQFNKPGEQAAIKAARLAAISAIQSIPPLKPAIEQDAPVAVQFTLPIALQPE